MLRAAQGVSFQDSLVWWPEVLRRAWAATGDSGSRCPEPRVPASALHACSDEELFSWGPDAGERVPGGDGVMAGVAGHGWRGTCAHRECRRCGGELDMHAALRRFLLDGARGQHSPIASVLKATEVRHWAGGPLPICPERKCAISGLVQCA